jgi:hypothetical protein
MFLAAGTSFSSGPAQIHYTVVSEYQSPDGEHSSQFRRWLVTVVDTPNKGRTISFSSIHSKTKAFLCTVTVDDEGAVVWHGKVRGRTKRSSDGIMVLPGHPLPCDIIPSRNNRKDLSFQDKTTAGGRVFIKTYSLSYQTVSPDTAVAEGWIKDSIPPDLPALEMRTILDDDDQPVVRQLWPEGGSWWIYEETPFRRSWLVENDARGDSSPDKE